MGRRRRADRHLPAKVYLYQRNLEDVSKTAADLRRELRLTLRHTYAASVKDEAQLGRLIDDRIAALRKWVRLTP